MAENIDATHFITAYLDYLGPQTKKGVPVAAFVRAGISDDGPTIEIADLNNPQSKPFVIFTATSITGRRWTIEFTTGSKAYAQAKSIHDKFRGKLDDMIKLGEDVSLQKTSAILIELTKSVSSALC